MAKRKGKSITLKEAAALSGYAPDYVGQLIRQGKLPGEQVYSNVSWVTTEEALEEYMQRAASGSSKRSTWWENYLSVDTIADLYVWLLRGLVGLLVLVILSLLYVFAVAVDHRLEAAYIEAAAVETPYE